jgi:hypothetical protein
MEMPVGIGGMAVLVYEIYLCEAFGQPNWARNLCIRGEIKTFRSLFVLCAMINY